MIHIFSAVEVSCGPFGKIGSLLVSGGARIPEGHLLEMAVELHRGTSIPAQVVHMVIPEGGKIEGTSPP